MLLVVLLVPEERTGLEMWCKQNVDGLELLTPTPGIQTALFGHEDSARLSCRLKRVGTGFGHDPGKSHTV